MATLGRSKIIVAKLWLLLVFEERLYFILVPLPQVGCRSKKYSKIVILLNENLNLHGGIFKI